MINYDMHIHTEYCGHAPGMSIKAIIDAAEKKQLDSIAITSHIFCEDDLLLIPKIQKEVANIKTNVNVIVGAEVDADGMRTDGRLITDRLDGIPYVLGSMHYIPGTGVFPTSLQDNPLDSEDFFQAWQSTLIGLVSNPRIDTLAHPGRLAAQACDIDIFFEDMLAVFHHAAELSAKNNICWGVNELNEKKIPQNLHSKWNKIYEIAIDVGVKLIYGSDAHKPENIGKQDYTNKTLSVIGEKNLGTPQSIGII